MNLHAKMRSEKARILEALELVEPGTDEYSNLINQLQHLNQAHKGVFGVDANTLINAAVSIGSVLLVLNHERVGILTSKAVGFIPKVR